MGTSYTRAPVLAIMAVISTSIPNPLLVNGSFWISGVRNTYLFSDQDGMNSFSIGLHRLADKLRRGEAVLVERKSITESAFGKLMNLFRQKLGYA